MLRPLTPNHGTLRPPNDDDHDDLLNVYMAEDTARQANLETTC